MKLRILFLLLFSQVVDANQVDHCKLIAESAGMIMQLRQFGVDLNTAFNLKGELSNNAKNLEEFNLAVEETARVLKENGFLIVNIFVNDNRLNKEFTKSKMREYLYFTKNGLPIILLPVHKLINIFLKNNFKILSFQEKLITLEVGKRKLFKGVFKKEDKTNFLFKTN